MITEDVTEVLTLIYSFSDNQDLEKAMEYGKKYLRQYTVHRYSLLDCRIKRNCEE